MGGFTLCNAYEIAIRSKNFLIQVGNIAPRPPMPIFLKIQGPINLPPIASIPTTTTIGYQVVSQENVVSEQNREMQEIKNMLQSLGKTFSNEFVSLKRQLKQEQRPNPIPF